MSSSGKEHLIPEIPGWSGDSAGKSSDCLSSSLPSIYLAAQSSVIPVPGDRMPSSSSHEHQAQSGVRTYRQTELPYTYNK